MSFWTGFLILAAWVAAGAALLLVAGGAGGRRQKGAPPWWEEEAVGPEVEGPWWMPEERIDHLAEPYVPCACGAHPLQGRELRSADGWLHGPDECCNTRAGGLA